MWHGIDLWGLGTFGFIVVWIGGALILNEIQIRRRNRK